MLQSPCKSEAVLPKQKHIKEIGARQQAAKTDIPKANFADQALNANLTEEDMQADHARPQVMPLRRPPGLQLATRIQAPHAANNMSALQAPPDTSSSKAASGPEASHDAEQTLVASLTEINMQADHARPQMMLLRRPPDLQLATGIQALHAANNMSALQAPPGFLKHCASDRLVAIDGHTESAISPDTSSSRAASGPEASHVAEQALVANLTEANMQADHARPQRMPLRRPPGLQLATGIQAPHAANNMSALQAPPGFFEHCASDRLVAIDGHIESAISPDTSSSKAASGPEASYVAEQAILGSPTSRGMPADPAQLAEGQVFCICACNACSLCLRSGVILSLCHLWNIHVDSILCCTKKTSVGAESCCFDKSSASAKRAHLLFWPYHVDMP